MATEQIPSRSEDFVGLFCQKTKWKYNFIYSVWSLFMCHGCCALGHHCVVGLLSADTWLPVFSICFQLAAGGLQRGPNRHNGEIFPRNDSCVVTDTGWSNMLIMLNSCSVPLVDSDHIRAAKGLQSHRASRMVRLPKLRLWIIEHGNNFLCTDRSTTALTIKTKEVSRSFILISRLCWV